MVQSILNLDEYSTRVLDVIKGKYGLKNRNEAINRFIHEFGEVYLEMPINEEYLKELDEKIRSHEEKHGQRNMSLEELDEILDLGKNV